MTRSSIYLKLISVFSLISFPEASKSYTFIQCAERIRRLRKGLFPATPKNIVALAEILMQDDNRQFAETLQNSPNR